MKKFLKLAMYSLLVIALIFLIGIAYFFTQFNNFELKDTYKINQNNIAYYKNSYDENREAFLQKAEDLRQIFPDLRIIKIKVPSRIDDDLTIDLCFVPSKDSSRMLIMSSGVHGVESYVGSAMQMNFMDQYVNKAFVEKCGLLLIHAINPFGNKYDRRVSENNVDLNRNSDISKELFQTTNEGYEVVSGMINPSGTANPKTLSNRFFFIKAISNILKTGMGALRQAIVQGQYTYPKGLFYGGSEFEPQILELKGVLDSIIDPYKTVLAIDLHTGYGDRGAMHLFPNPVEDNIRKSMEQLFEGYQIDWGDTDDFYTVTGDFVSFVGKIKPEKAFIPMTYEFGTMNSKTTMGTMKSIHNMILENQGSHYGYKSEKDSIEVKKNFREMYFPSSKSWQSNSVEIFKQVMDSVIPRYLEFEVEKAQ